MRKFAGILLFSTLLFSPCFAIELASPNGHIQLIFEISDIDGKTKCPNYSIFVNKKELIAPSGLGFELADGTDLTQDFELVSVNTSTHDETWKPVYGERELIRNHYNQMTVKIAQNTEPQTIMDLTFRCFNSGAAFCYTIHNVGTSKDVNIKEERTEFRFLKDHTAWTTDEAQGPYRKTTISRVGKNAERPLTIQADSTGYTAIAEAKLVDYARMKLAVSDNDSLCLLSTLGSHVNAALPLTTPWRVIMVADSPGQLLEQNDIILNLNDPCAIDDVSWIKPGKVIRETTLTTDGGLACVDFAVKHNLQYVEFDAGWYGFEHVDSSDATTITVDAKRSAGPLDLHHIIHYAASKNIGIILYVNRRALERQLDEILPLYQKWGVSGVKYGFVQVGSQEWTSWLHMAIRKAAAHRLMVDVHDEYRPTGYSRTFPNFMTQEGIRGDEEKQTNDLGLTTLFTRLLAGAGDNTICYYNSRVDTYATHAYQLAKAVCFYSPWQFLYWYDRPPSSRDNKSEALPGNVIGDEPELEFFDAVPTVWDETRVLAAEIGKYAVIARRSDKEWFVGAMSSGPERIFTCNLDFLNNDETYLASIYSDDMNAATRTHVEIERFLVNHKTMLKMHVLENGGCAVRIVPVKPGLEGDYPLYE